MFLPVYSDHRTDYTDYQTIYDFTLLNGCTGKCVRLSRLLAFECTLNHCTFIHSFITFAWTETRFVQYSVV